MGSGQAGDTMCVFGVLCGCARNAQIQPIPDFWISKPYQMKIDFRYTEITVLIDGQKWISAFFFVLCSPDWEQKLKLRKVIESFFSRFLLYKDIFILGLKITGQRCCLIVKFTPVHTSNFPPHNFVYLIKYDESQFSDFINFFMISILITWIR